MASFHSSAAARIAELELPGNVFVGRVLTDAPRRLASGVEQLDAALRGGWPRGRLSEIVGQPSSGRTSALLDTLAAATRGGEVAAYIDACDSLDPASLADAGVVLPRCLWVRPPSAGEAARCAELVLQSGGFAVVVLDFGDQLPRRVRSHVWPRLARAAERSRSALVVAAPQRLAGGFAAASVAMQVERCCWTPGAWPLFEGLRSHPRRLHCKL
ncbi:MAG TPA: hypothetical protein VEB21_01815 [Terriglobales bacterium]|nr:hypothetical protein [Terriglobales bacterium]